MPIYEYTCRACGAETEKLQKLSDPDWVECPSCGKPKLQRTVSAAGFRLSGSGWYETDFKKDGKRNLSGDSEGSSSSSKESTKASSDSSTTDKNSKSSKSESKPKKKESVSKE